MRLSITAPVLALAGLLVVTHRSEPVGKVANVAVLDGDQIKIVDQAAPDPDDAVAVGRDAHRVGALLP